MTKIYFQFYQIFQSLSEGRLDGSSIMAGHHFHFSKAFICLVNHFHSRPICDDYDYDESVDPALGKVSSHAPVFVILCLCIG